MKTILTKLCMWVLAKTYKPDVDSLIGRIEKACDLALEGVRKIELTETQIKDFKSNIFRSTQAGIDATAQIGIDYDNLVFDAYIANLVDLGIAKDMAFLSKEDYHKTIIKLGESRTKMTRKLWDIIQTKLLVLVIGELKPGEASLLKMPVSLDGYNWDSMVPELPEEEEELSANPEDPNEIEDLMDEVNKVLGLKNNKGNLPH